MEAEIKQKKLLESEETIKLQNIQKKKDMERIKQFNHLQEQLSLIHISNTNTPEIDIELQDIFGEDISVMDKNNPVTSVSCMNTDTAK